MSKKPCLIAVIVLLLFLIPGCSPVTDPGSQRLDPDLAGIWVRDDDSSSTDTFGDERIVFGADGSITYADYLDPDGPGPEVIQWISYTYGYEWLNGYYHDYSANPAPNNYISGSVLARDSSGNAFLLFQYRYNPHPGQIDVLTPNSHVGTWVRQ